MGIGLLILVAGVGAAPLAPPPAQTNGAACGEAVNGLKVTLVPLYDIVLRKGARVQPMSLAGVAGQAFTFDQDGGVGGPCEIMAGTGASMRVEWYCLAPPHKAGAMVFQQADIVQKKATGYFTVRFENVGKETMVVYRDRCCEFYDRVFVTGPDGKRLPARQDNRVRLQHARPEPVVLAPGKSDGDFFDPWWWVVEPAVPGAYTLCAEFERRMPATIKRPLPKGYWTGKVRSNEVKLIPAGGSASAALPKP